MRPIGVTRSRRIWIRHRSRPAFSRSRLQAEPHSHCRRLLSMINVIRPRTALLFTLLAADPASARRIDLVDQAKLPRFEVVSVKPGEPKSDVHNVSFPPGRFVQDNMPLLNVVSLAFDAPVSIGTTAAIVACRLYGAYGGTAAQPNGAAAANVLVRRSHRAPSSRLRQLFRGPR